MSIAMQSLLGYALVASSCSGLMQICLQERIEIAVASSEASKSGETLPEGVTVPNVRTPTAPMCKA